MTAGKYFNRNVLALDYPYIGYVVQETIDQIVVFGEGNKRYDIPLSEIKFVSKNVLVGLNLLHIEQKYKKNRNSPLPNGKDIHSIKTNSHIPLASYEGKYDKSLFNKGVRLENEDHVGHIMKETNDTIIIFGHGNDRYDVPKSKIIAVGRNVILGLDWSLLYAFKVDRNKMLMTQIYQ
jgi:sporulation protein YlmC with PRC-barrel domain